MAVNSRRFIMKKLVIVCVSFMAILLLTAGTIGCGGSSSASAPEALEKSNTAMNDVLKFKMKAEAKTNMDMEGGSGTMEMEMKADMSDEEAPKVQVAAAGMGTDSDIYMFGQYTYMNIPGQGWVKAAVTDMSDYEQMTPTGVSNMTEGAENVKMVSETDDYYEISFDVGQKYLQSLFGDESLGDELGEEFSKMMEEMLKGLSISIVVKIDKKTSYITDAKMKMDFKDIPMVGDMSMDMNMEYDDFNGAFEVELPAEANDAREVSPEELETLKPSTGLGI